jgi:ribosome assembly protein RRB1
VCVQDSKKGDGSSSSSGPSIPAKVWQPGVDKLEEDEELQCDPSAYNSLHAFHIGWPCLRCCEFFLFSVWFPGK